MALMKGTSEHESSRLLEAKLNALNNKEHHESVVSSNGHACGGEGGEPLVLIKMVSPTQTAFTDKPSSVDDCSVRLEPERKDPEETCPEAEEDENSPVENWCGNCYLQAVEQIQKKVFDFLYSKKTLITTLFKSLALLGYLAYFIYCMVHNFGDEGSYKLLAGTVVGLLIVVKKKVSFRCRGLSLKRFTTLCTRSRQARRLKCWLKWVLHCGMIVTFVVITVVDMGKTDNLQSLIGLLGFIVILFLFSSNPAKVNWHPVFWGIVIQWILAVIILRTQWGQVVFEWVGKQVHEFLNFGLYGAEFVFGKEYTHHRVAMVTVSLMLYFNAVIYILFHLGVIQAIINSFGRFLAVCLDTNPIESFAASSNIFVSLTEAPLLLRPFLNSMTRSELHTVMTCGFASISGSVLGTFVETAKIPPNHLLTASVMSAPAALAISKLMCPETERSKLREVESEKITAMRYRNVLQAASAGAVQAIPIAAATLANQLAFVSLLAFCDSTIKWFAERAGVRSISFKWLCSYLFYPLVFAMGTEANDCRALGSLLGIKLFSTPIISYMELGSLRANRLMLEDYIEKYPNASWSRQGEDILLELTNYTLSGGVISERSEVIATYMLCGISTITSIGVCLGVLLPLAYERKDDIIDMVVNALVAGNFASFMTAAIAGLMYKGKPLPL